jgi:hypothetical protein
MIKGGINIPISAKIGCEVIIIFNTDIIAEVRLTIDFGPQ